MDIKVLNERETGIFSKKIYIGRFFSEKSIDDFNGDERKFLEYLESIDKDEYVFMREATTTEAKQMGKMAVDENIINKLDAEKQVAYYEKQAEENLKFSDSITEVAKKCIVASSFTNNGNPATPKEIGDILFKSTQLVNYLLQKWMKSSVVFPKKSDETLDTSAK